ncbi:Mu transposase domain-containing protein [Terrabacter sp. 2TAF16]|uniref:Mu transposase domain-containing protein n=1 Tax=Terrabacter sp. 2TAF16 TaxID=3233008 RepID=UPI003F97FDC9
MLPLPPVPPAVGWVNRVRLGRDYYVRVDSNWKSISGARCPKSALQGPSGSAGSGSSRAGSDGW